MSRGLTTLHMTCQKMLGLWPIINLMSSLNLEAEARGGCHPGDVSGLRLQPRQASRAASPGLCPSQFCRSSKQRRALLGRPAAQRKPLGSRGSLLRPLTHALGRLRSAGVMLLAGTADSGLDREAPPPPAQPAPTSLLSAGVRMEGAGCKP